MRSIERRTPARRVDLRRSRARLGMFGRLGLMVSLVGGVGLLGCGDIQPVAPATGPVTDPTQLYMTLAIDYPAVNLDTAAGYNTQQLTATPRDAAGNAMAGLPAPTFSSRDTTKVRVTANGLLTAVGATNGSPVSVVATLTVGPLTHVDSALVVVNDLPTPPRLASLSIHPIPPDTLWFTGADFNDNDASIGILGYAGYDYRPTSQALVVPRATDSAGNAIDGLLIEYVSLDPAVATIYNPGTQPPQAVRPMRPGRVRMVARTMAYGIAKADTVVYTVTWPFFGSINILRGPTGTLDFVPSEIRIRPSGFMFWANKQADMVDVVFDDPTNVAIAPTPICDVLDLFISFGGVSPGSTCGVGNILIPGMPAGGLPAGPNALGGVGTRQFPLPGVYSYHSTRTGAAGKIIVTDDPN